MKESVIWLLEFASANRACIEKIMPLTLAYLRMYSHEEDYIKEPAKEVITIPIIPPRTTLKVVLPMGLSVDLAETIPATRSPQRVNPIIPEL